MKLLVIAGPFLALALSVAGLPQSSALAEPLLTEITPEDGAVLDEPPTLVHMCFSETLAFAETEEFKFKMLTPAAFPLGLRIEFLQTTPCVDVFVGQAPAESSGTWTFEWQVTSAATGEVAEGTLHYQVDPSASPDQPTTPAASPGEGPGATNEGRQPSADDGNPWLILVLAVVGVTVLAGVVFALRRRRRQL